MRGNSVRPLAAKEAEALFQLCLWLQVTVVKWNMRAHPDLNQGPADLQSAALTTELCDPCAQHARQKLQIRSMRSRGEGTDAKTLVEALCSDGLWGVGTSSARPASDAAGML